MQQTVDVDFHWRLFILNNYSFAFQIAMLTHWDFFSFKKISKILLLLNGVKELRVGWLEPKNICDAYPWFIDAIFKSEAFL